MMFKARVKALEKEVARLNGKLTATRRVLFRESGEMGVVSIDAFKEWRLWHETAHEKMEKRIIRVAQDTRVTNDNVIKLLAHWNLDEQQKMGRRSTD